VWRRCCDCGKIKVIRREVLVAGVKGSCDRCAKLAKPAYRKVIHVFQFGNVPTVFDSEVEIELH
jgi:hypothetical protein